MSFERFFGVFGGSILLFFASTYSVFAEQEEFAPVQIIRRAEIR